MTNDERTFRKAESTDAQALLTLLKALGTETTTFSISGELPVADEEAKEIEKINAGNDHVIIIALAGDQLVGLATITPTVDTKAGEIGVAVLKKYWRQGIGLELMLSALDWAAIESSYNEISLTVQKNNLGAVALYQKIGFETITTSHVENSVGELVEAYEMAIALE
ncbi:GNAT family N-acetyltransferase [Secundilactobacillus collinoides]|uniref:N-acetyltransferase domain-containing protein n=2 Tax=Secundilactobacillus collinoides TaxID=33960 RepID=A0A0R2B8A1_SECCO|nr:GNAT family N-acetyltransferase [Secundilactobacillus collinoides]KRM75383.1 hypothetical protein FC82_GL002252 [Secundilactobacillus collinoides DSM 20515 = JCM 1123]KZL39190.1 hypothetical protein TY91_10600 [Secundilactobacillus collinoides]